MQSMGDMDSEPFGNPELEETLKVTCLPNPRFVSLLHFSKVSSHSSFLLLMTAHSALGSVDF